MKRTVKSMTDEWSEFLAYTHFPEYKSDKSTDTTYMGRFVFSMFEDFHGFARILTILARGFLFHTETGRPAEGDPYDGIEYARRALLAWCSIPDKSDAEPRVCFPELSAEFPNLVDTEGRGWLVRHVRNIIAFVRANKNAKASAVKAVDRLSATFTDAWQNKVRHIQVPIFSANTQKPWSLRLDDVIADALTLGPLRMGEFPLPTEWAERIKNTDLNGVKPSIVTEVVRFILANKQPDTDWVVFPVVNFSAYLGSETFSKTTKYKLPKELVLFDKDCNGLVRAKVVF